MSDFRIVAPRVSPPTTRPTSTLSDHTDAVLNIIFGTTSAESRAQSLIVLVSDHRKSIWEHRDGAEKAFKSAMSELAAEQNKMLEREWQTIDLQFEGPFWRLCQTSDTIDGLWEAFRLGRDYLLQSRSEVKDLYFAEQEHQSLLRDFFRPWNLIAGAMRVSNIGEDSRTRFAERRQELRERHEDWEYLSAGQHKAFSLLDKGEGAAISKDETAMRASVSEVHFDRDADVCEGPMGPGETGYR